MPVAAREFQVMAKPIGAVCNLACAYCYYLEKADLYPKRTSFRMSDEVLERYIVQHIEACPEELIFFAWHGGEPTLLGLDYFRKIVELQRKHRPPGRPLRNGIQTNGTLLDEDWCRFLAQERFQVGISMDGPKELHDAYRVSKGEQGTHAQVLRSFRLLKKHGIDCDVLCVVNRKNVRHPAGVYRFFRDIGVKFLQFLPLVVRQSGHGAGEHGVSAESVPAEAYGTFLSGVFDEWMRNDVGRIALQNFDEASRPYLGLKHSICISREVCGDIVIVEHNGDFYCCDHFVTPAHRLGNINERPLVELLNSPEMQAFGEQKRTLPRYCRECEFLSSCNGGCPKDRFVRTPDGEDGLNYLCPGLKVFFAHCRPNLQRMAALVKSGKPAAQIMDALRAEAVASARQAGRNEPCPCGSGLKYKKCCMGKGSTAVRPWE